MQKNRLNSRGEIKFTGEDLGDYFILKKPRKRVNHIKNSVVKRGGVMEKIDKDK